MTKGYSFGGKRAEHLKARLRAIKADPEGAKKLFAGKAPKNYPPSLRKGKD